MCWASAMNGCVFHHPLSASDEAGLKLVPESRGSRAGCSGQSSQIDRSKMGTGSHRIPVIPHPQGQVAPAGEGCVVFVEGRSERSQQPKRGLQRKLHKAYALDAVEDVLEAYLVSQGSYRTRLKCLESELLLLCRSFELIGEKYQATLVAVNIMRLADHLDDGGCRLARPHPC